MEELDRLGWVVHRSYEIAGVVFGLRTNSAPFCRWLDEVLGRYRVDDEVDAFYSVLVGPKRAKLGRRLHILYADTRAVVRTTDVRILGATLLAELQTIDFSAREDALYGDLTVVARNGRRALVPGTVSAMLATIGHRAIEKAGLVLPITTSGAIDRVSGETIPPARTLEVPAEALAGLEALAGPDSAEQRVIVDAPMPIDAVFSIGMTDAIVEPVSKAVALYRLASHVVNLHKVGAETAFASLHRLVERADCYQLGVGGPQDMLEGLARALRADVR